jgi:hypothetical protein
MNDARWLDAYQPIHLNSSVGYIYMFYVQVIHFINYWYTNLQQTPIARKKKEKKKGIYIWVTADNDDYACKEMVL